MESTLTAPPLTVEEQVPALLANLPERICDVVTPWAERMPDQVAVVEASGSWTYLQLAASIDKTSEWLLSIGVRPGDRVVLVCENSRAFVAILLALAKIGAWPVLVNARLSAREVDQIREHCSARLTLYTIGASQQASEHAGRGNAAIQEPADWGKVAVGALNEDTTPEPRETDPAENVAALIYTSGTTGTPKGIMLSHRNVLFLAAVSAKIRSLSLEDRLYGVLPMSHAVGLSVVLLGSLMSGATIYLSPRFDPMTARTILEKQDITVMLGSPAMFTQFAQYAKWRGLKKLSFSALRIISSSGAPLDAVTKSETEALFGMVLHNGYGVTECSPTIAQTRVEDPRQDTTVGRIFPGIEVRLTREDGRIVETGEVGELHVRGPNIMKGYYRAPEETAAAVNGEGWFNTRDLARIEDGNLYIVGRTKELIVRSGFNVYPAEIESVLNSHPGVARSAVIGRSTKGNEEVLAFVQPLPEISIREAEIAEYAAQHLAAYKRPSRFFLVPTMPATLTGKVIKGELVNLLNQIEVGNSIQ